MTWQFNNKDISTDDIPSKAIGFVYLIEQISTGKKYIGRKLLTKAATKMINGKKKKIRKPSDWENYWSSSSKLLALIEEFGHNDFKRTILTFVSSKGMLVYAEELSLYALGVLEDDNWINDNIRSKVYRTWVKKEEAVQLRNSIKIL